VGVHADKVVGDGADARRRRANVGDDGAGARQVDERKRERAGEEGRLEAPPARRRRNHGQAEVQDGAAHAGDGEVDHGDKADGRARCRVGRNGHDAVGQHGPRGVAPCKQPVGGDGAHGRDGNGAERRLEGV